MRKGYPFFSATISFTPTSFQTIDRSSLTIASGGSNSRMTECTDDRRESFLFFIISTKSFRTGKNEKSGSLPDDNRGRLVKRVLPHCKVEEVRVMDLEIFHVFYPFNDKLAVYTLDISSEMTFISCG